MCRPCPTLGSPARVALHPQEAPPAGAHDPRGPPCSALCSCRESGDPPRGCERRKWGVMCVTDGGQPRGARSPVIRALSHGEEGNRPPRRLSQAPGPGPTPGAESPAFLEAPGPRSTLGCREVTQGCVPAPRRPPAPDQLGVGPGLECAMPPPRGVSQRPLRRVPWGHHGGAFLQTQGGARLEAPPSGDGALGGSELLCTFFMSPDGQGWGLRLPPTPLKAA